MRSRVQPAWGSRVSGIVTARGVQEQSCLMLTSDIPLHGFTYQKHEKKKIFWLRSIRPSEDVQGRYPGLSGVSHSVWDTALSKLIPVSLPEEISANLLPQNTFDSSSVCVIRGHPLMGVFPIFSV